MTNTNKCKKLHTFTVYTDQIMKIQLEKALWSCPERESRNTKIRQDTIQWTMTHFFFIFSRLTLKSGWFWKIVQISGSYDLKVNVFTDRPHYQTVGWYWSHLLYKPTLCTYFLSYNFSHLFLFFNFKKKKLVWKSNNKAFCKWLKARLVS